MMPVNLPTRLGRTTLLLLFLCSQLTGQPHSTNLGSDQVSLSSNHSNLLFQPNDDEYRATKNAPMQTHQVEINSSTSGSFFELPPGTFQIQVWVTHGKTESEKGKHELFFKVTWPVYERFHLIIIS